MPWFLLFSAEQRVSSSLSALLIATVPLFAAVVAWVTRSDRLDARRLAGLAVGFGGVGVLVGFDVGHSDVLATLALGVVGLGYALGPWVVAHRLADLPSLGVVGVALATCALAYAPVAAFEIPGRAVAPEVVWSVVGLTGACTVVAFMVFFALIAEVGAVRATVITYVNPAVAVLVGVGALGERFGVATGVGFALILVGCVLATRSVPGGATLVTPPVAEP